jgi:hypothetical protein
MTPRPSLLSSPKIDLADGFANNDPGQTWIVLQFHRRRGEHQGADTEGQVASVALAGGPAQGFVYDVSTGRLSEVFSDGETATS